MSGPPILPTNTCFDDALDFISARVKVDPRLVEKLYLVHLIALQPDGENAGQPFAHAWVEEADSAWPSGWVVWQGGFLEGLRICWAADRDELATKMRIQDSTRYTVREAYLENERTVHFGPWLERYVKLCK